MKRMEKFPEQNPNPVLSAGKDGTILYSNIAGEPLLNAWGVRVGEILPPSFRDFVQMAISSNSPKKIEVRVDKRVYIVAFHPLSEEECVNIYGFDISDQKELEDRLRESEERLRLLGDNLPDSVVYQYTHESDGNVRFLYCSAGIKKLNGISPLDVLRDPGTLHRQILPDYFEKLVEAEARSAHELSDFEMDLPMRRPDGQIRWMRLLSHPRRLSDGRTIWDGVQIDITERKQTDEALKRAHENLEQKVKERTIELENAYNSLKESEKSLAEAQKLAHIGSYDNDLVSDKLYWSDELYRIFGLQPQEDMTFNKFLTFIHPDDKHYVNNAVIEAINGKHYAINYRIVRPDGEVRIIHSEREAIFDKMNKPIRAKGTIQDITESKKAEEKLRESEEKYRNIVETANEGIGIIDNEFKLTFINKKLEDMIGYSAEEIMGKPMWDFISEESKPIVNLILERGLQDFENPELKFIRKDGSPLWAQVNAKPIFDSDGKFKCIITMLSDINKRKEAEESLAKIEIARKKEIHHRIKNNLQVISSLLDLQAEQFRNRRNINDSEVLEAFRESQDRVISMALIHEELYKGEEFETLNFSLYIKKLAENLFNTYKLENIDISLDMDLDENIFLNMDTAVPLGIVVNELVSNSLKHAFPDREKGEIRIKLSREENEEHIKSINEDCKSTNLTLTVSDDGIGISESLDIENLDSLGFQLVISLVHQLDGEFELKRDKGTEFIIKFTVTEKDNSASNPANN